ncbi:exodeoxyribonuclease VII large subunit [Anaeromusa sp.]|uniref:exodeoxyribonuclease VII large subunit n=1 Tax=Anaeromusa sp. TaxID=1872520 RepID=UPI0026359DD6|nr:exodeoxyribonuclease VII large subunit [Anaeromusa sp.]MDD3156905.1 exodeoxyribonuclease VII large subunit [Anaeromusa sp.]
MGILTVSDVTAYVKRWMDKDALLSSVYVRGEVSNFKRHSSGHCYFTLKDAGAVLRAVLFRSRAQYLKFEPQNGMQVIVSGRLSVFERDGQYQLYGDRMTPDGIGELSLAYAQLKDKLEREGLFQKEKKRPLPLLPRAVGIITSPTGAAVRDIRTVAKRRFAGIPLILSPVAVQGPAAAGEITAAIRLLASHPLIDVLIVGRGGGSIEELWAFNEEIVVRAIASSPIPVISAVGHETDFTLADFAADMRAATPSQAAEFAVPDRVELERRLQQGQFRLRQALANDLLRRKQHLRQLWKASVFTKPERLLAPQRQSLDGLQERLVRAAARQCEEKRRQWLLVSQKLALLNPLGMLQRGYAFLSLEETGEPIRSVEQVFVDSQLNARVQDGALRLRVMEIKRGDS